MPTRRNFVTGSALAASSLIPITSVVAAESSKEMPMENTGQRPRSAMLTLVENPTTFNQAWAYFNSQSWSLLRGLLADDVTLVKINDNTSVRGKGDVMRYLKRNVSLDGEKFDPTVAGASINWNTSGTTVSGYADWADHDNDQGTTTHTLVYYRFRFNGTPGYIDRMYA